MNMGKLGRFAKFFGFASLFLCLQNAAVSASSLGTTRFVLDGNRVYAELSFVLPNRTTRPALTYVDMGSASLTLSEPLFNDLKLDEGQPLTFKLGAFAVTIPAAKAENSHQPARPLGKNNIAAILPASVLKNFQVVLDYKARTLTLALPGTLNPEGIATPFHLNGETGIIAIDAMIDGKPYAITIDNGSAWSWVRQDVLKTWLAHHPS